MKLKYYLRGAGIGVIVSTLILMIAFGVNQRKTEEPVSGGTEDSARELTIAEALSELETETGSTETKTDPQSTETKTEIAPAETEAQVSATEAADETVGEDTREEPEETMDAEETGEAAPGDAPEEPETSVEVKKTVSVVVQGGDSPKVVAEKLVHAGVVDDADHFYDYLLEHGLNDGIEIGSFSIPEGADYETVAKIITTNEYESRMQR